jgi:glycosyltransferase involved in cell wall biosynthesis
MYTIDISAAVHNRAGLGRYAAALARALADARPGQISLFHNQGADGRLPDNLADLPRRSVRLGYKPWRMAVLLAHWSRVSFDKLLPDTRLFHSAEHLLLPLRNAPTVVTIHDLIPKLFPEFHKKLNYYYLNLAMPLFCRRATAVIAVSESTKRDIIAHYNIDPAKIHVVYEAAAPHFKPASPEKIKMVRGKYQLPPQFVIHVSTIEPRKNLDRLLDALLLLRRERPDLQLVLVGAKGWLYDDFFARIADEGLTEAVRALGWVPDEDLPAVIGAASLAAQPSLYEGFGLPILEHMACGQVVAASRASSHPEVGGEAAAYFDPLHVEEMAAVIGRLLADPDEYQKRREMGLAQAARFSWRRAAQETLAVYDQLLLGK